MTRATVLKTDDVPVGLRNIASHRTGFEDEYPFDSHWMNIDGHVMHYVDEGSGPVLLMVHGNPTWSFAWRELIRELRANHRVIAIDHLGCGFSEKPQSDLYTLEQHISRLVAFTECLDLNGTTLLAHDWGGAIGMGAAGRMPERFSKFVLMNTGAFRSQQIPLRIAVCRIPWLGTLALRGLNLFSISALTMAVQKPLSNCARRGLLTPYSSWGNRVAVREFVRDIPLRPSHRSYSTLAGVEDSLTQFVDHPMQLIWGMKDWCFTPEFLQEFIARFPQAAVREIPDAGHYVFEDAGSEVVAVVKRFLLNS